MTTRRSMCILSTIVALGLGLSAGVALAQQKAIAHHWSSAKGDFHSVVETVKWVLGGEQFTQDGKTYRWNAATADFEEIAGAGGEPAKPFAD